MGDEMKTHNTHDDGRLFGFDGATMWTEPTLDQAEPTTPEYVSVESCAGQQDLILSFSIRVF